ncbi:MAG: tail fiber domain-containing protein, partial [Acutalibacteraceae bacterium]
DSENIISSGNTTLSGFSFVCPIMTQERLDTHANNFTSDSHAVHTFRPGKVTQLLGDPRIEVGDVLPLNPVYDENNAITSAECYIPVMSLVMKYDGGLMNEITALDFEEDSSLSLAQRIDFAEKSAKKASVYSQAASEFSGLISGGLGMYRTEVVDASGAVKTYIHDQPTLESSSYIVTYNSQGFAFTSGNNCWNNGNPTWTNGVSRDGNAVIRTLIANKINVDDIVAQGATIGGWSINGSRIEKDNTSSGGYRVGIQSGGSTVNGNLAAFYAGCSTASGGSIASEASSNFYVTHAGYLFANNAKIKGNITATSLTLDGCTIPYSSLSDAPNLDVYQRKDGSIIRGTVSEGSNGISISTAGLLQASNAVIYGTVYASAGKIANFTIDGNLLYTGSESKKTLLRNVSGDDSIVFAAGAAGLANANIGAAPFYIRNNGSFYASSGTIGGFSISNVRLWTADGTWGSDGCIMLHSTGTSSSASIGGSSTISGWVITAGSNFGVTKSGKLYAESANISGTITSTAGNLKMVTAGGIIQLQQKISDSDSWTTYGKISALNGALNLTGTSEICYNAINHSFYDDSENEYARMYTGSQSTSAGTRFFDVSGSTLCIKSVRDDSDRRMKENIVDIDIRFEKMFLDLKPWLYNFIGEAYVNVGFIAQEVQELLNKYGIENFNVVSSKPTDRPGFDGYILGMNYLKFIPLNTYMIQKCLSRISALENEISILKGAST